MNAPGNVHMMRKASSKATSSPAGTSGGSSREARLALAYERMESDLNDIHNMALLAAGTVEDIFNTDHSSVTGRREFYFVSSQRANMTLFSVYHLEQMIKGVMEAFYNTLEADADADIGAAP